MIETAERLCRGTRTEREKIERIFYFVRDEIAFGFPPEGDLLPASETIRRRMGQCNNKGTTFIALCRAAGIDTRAHFSLIRREIQRGLFTGVMYRLMPENLSHSWVEVRVEDEWRRVDTYINDHPFYLAGRAELKRRGWDTGFSISCSAGQSTDELDLDADRFVQMDAVVKDQGVWEDPGEYYASDLYRNRPGPLKLFVYRMMVGRINRKVAAVRSGCMGSLCSKEAAAEPKAVSAG